MMAACVIMKVITFQSDGVARSPLQVMQTSVPLINDIKSLIQEYTFTSIFD